jgi:hypothetical protein
MTEKSKDRGQTKCSPWSFELGVGLRTPHRKGFVIKSPEMEEAKINTGL